jgi:hypothetical protein
MENLELTETLQHEYKFGTMEKNLAKPISKWSPTDFDLLVFTLILIETNYDFTIKFHAKGFPLNS